MSLSRKAIDRPVAVAMFFLAIGVLGAISFERLPIDLLPDVSYPRLIVYTTYPGVAPAEVERFVTEPIEQVVSAVPGVEHIESVSRDGVSLITLLFAWGVDMDFAALNVREKLDNIRDRLPDEADRPAVLRTDPTSDPIMAISVAGGSDLFGLKELTEEVFKRRFEQIDGIARASVTGGLEREIHVEVNPRLLDSYGLTIQQVAEALDAANQSAPGGTIRRGRFRYSLRTVGEFQDIEEIRNVPLSRPQAEAGSISGIVRLSDVAQVSEGFRDRESITRYNGENSIGLLLFKESGANTVKVAAEVEEVVAVLQAENPQVTIDIATNQAGFIGDAISSVVQALLFGGILAFLVLFLFLRNARYPVAIALAIPISVVATFPLLDLAGVSLNIMSLGGLALGVGMLVDNSIVVLENIFRHTQLGKTAREAAAVGAEEVQTAIAASTLTTISVFGPIIYVEGVAGQLFGALSFAVAFALVASLIVALTLLPTMAARWGSGESEVAPGLVRRFFGTTGKAFTSVLAAIFRRPLIAFDRLFERFAVWYHGVLELALDNRGVVVLVGIALLAAGVGVGSTLERGVLPDVDQGSFQARLQLERGTPLQETSTATKRLEDAIAAQPGVDAVFARIGLQGAVGGIKEEVTGRNTATIDVRLERGQSTRAFINQLEEIVASFPVGVLAIETGQATALGRLLGGSDADMAVRIRGDNLDRAMSHARLLASQLGEVAAVTNVRLATEEGQPEILVEIDRDRAAAYGIEPSLVAEVVGRYMRGYTATEFVDFDQRIPIVVRLPILERQSLETLQFLTIQGVPLRELITTSETVGPSEIRRIDQSRTVTVWADVARGTLDDALAEVQRILNANPPPRGLRVDVGGENEERSKSFRELGFALMLAMVLVYMILAAQFESFVHPFTILLSVPLSIVGAAAALWYTGAGLNTMSLIGMVILVGIVVNDAIVKVDFINRMRAQGMELREAILQAAKVRLRPIIMTTVTTVLGLAPMALGLGSGSDLRAPLAIAVIGGLISATALTLIVVPVAYDLIEQATLSFKISIGFGAEGHERPAPDAAVSATDS